MKVPNDGSLNEVESALSAGAALGEPRVVTNEAGAGWYATIPGDYQVVPLNKFLPRPLRIEQNVTLHDAGSFIEYLKEFSEQGATHLFFNAEHEDFDGVLDYHSKAPGWCKHVASFRPRRSLEFQTWMNSNRKHMTQMEFARFIEENLPDIVEPVGAAMLETALSFEAKKDVEYMSGIRLNNGQIQFQYSEVVRGTSQKGTLEVPESFVLGIPIHVAGPGYKIQVRLRWRLQESHVMFSYEIVRPQRFLDDALNEICSRIETETGLAVLAGCTA